MKPSDFSSVSTPLAMMLAAACALTGLGLAGYTLFNAKGTSTFLVPPDAVAVVNDQPVARSDFLLELQNQGVEPGQATPQERKQALDQLVRQELFVQRAKEIDVASYDPDVRAAMVNSVEEEAAANASTARPSEAQLHAYYDTHKARYASEGTMTARDLVFAPARAAAAAQALKNGAAADQVVRQFAGRDTGRLDGEEFYFAAKLHLGDILFAAASRLAKGAVSDPVAMPDGAHVILMTDNQPPLPMRYDEARPRVLNDATKEAIGTAGERQEAFLRRRANILIADDLK